MKLGILIFLCALLLTTKNVQAASFFVSEVHSADAGQDLTKSLKALVVSSVTSAGGSQASDEQSADFVLKPDLIKLGGAFILTITKFKKGEAVYSSKQKAASIEELDDASDRAVRAAILGTQAKKDTRVGEVKARDENQLQTRIKSHNTSYFGFGVGSLTNMGNSKLAYDFAIGHNWEVTPRSQIKVLTELFASSDWNAYLGAIQLGLNLFLNDEDSSPYLGAGLGFAGSGSGSSSATTLGGFAGSVGVGMQFFRTSSTQFDIFAGYTIEFANNTIGAPGALGLRIGILY